MTTTDYYPPGWITSYVHGRCLACRVVYQWPGWRCPVSAAHCPSCHARLRQTTGRVRAPVHTIKEPA